MEVEDVAADTGVGAGEAAAMPDPAQAAEALLAELSKPDAIMGVNVGKEAKRYIRENGGQTAQSAARVTRALADSYVGYAQTCNLLQDWLVISGETEHQVRSFVQDEVKGVVKQSFDAEKATSIFDPAQTGAAEVWLSGLIAHGEWRKLIYELSEENKSSLVLNYIIKLISDAGFQNEIASVSTVANQLDVFSAVLAHAISNVLSHANAAEEVSLDGISSMACINQGTYLYCQALLHACMDGAGTVGLAIRCISQESAASCADRGSLVARYTLLLSKATAHPEVLEGLVAILEASVVTPVTIRTLYDQYTLDQPPPVELLRFPQLLEILVRSLFSPAEEGATDSSFADACAHVLSYAVSVFEEDGAVNTDYFAITLDAVTKVVDICTRNAVTASSVAVLYEHLNHPVVALGLIHWTRKVVLEPDFFSEYTSKRIPPHFGIIDQIVQDHPALNAHVLELLQTIFEFPYNIDVQLLVELKRQVLDRIIFQLLHGYAVPVMDYISNLLVFSKIDLSLAVHFVAKVSDSIGGPFSAAVVEAMLRILGKDGVAAGIVRKSDARRAVQSFLRDAAGTPDLGPHERQLLATLTATIE